MLIVKFENTKAKENIVVSGFDQFISEYNIAAEKL